MKGLKHLIHPAGPPFVLSVVLVLFSCGTHVTARDKDIIDSVNQFWNLSLVGDKERLANLIHQAPDKFWTACPPIEKAPDPETRGDRLSNSDGPVGQGVGLSISEKESSFWLLKYFTEQISTGKAELLRSRIISATDDEAIVKVDYVSRQDKEKGGWLSQDLLLYKDETGWKAFMITNPRQLAEYNRIFASNRPCS